MTRDLMYGTEVRALVRDAYRDVPPTTSAIAHRIYGDEELEAVPQASIDRALGVAGTTGSP